jgi:hypothetical protein
MSVGRRRNNWEEITWYEPIFRGDHKDLTIEGQAPDIAIYSRSHGEPTHNEPMLGEVAWEPLFDPSNFETGNRKEKLELQKKFLYDAWRYLTADDPDDIIII